MVSISAIPPSLIDEAPEGTRLDLPHCKEQEQQSTLVPLVAIEQRRLCGLLPLAETVADHLSGRKLLVSGRLLKLCRFFNSESEVKLLEIWTGHRFAG